MLTSMSVNASSSKNVKVNTPENIIAEEEFKKEIKNYLTEKYGEEYPEKLLRNQNSVKEARKIENLLIKNSKETIYPNYIGGLYINNNDDLVIQIVRKNIPKQNTVEYLTYQKLLLNDNKIISYVDYSYEELNKIHDVILNEYMGNYENLKGLYVSPISNRVVVELENCSDELIKQFKEEVVDSPMISFVTWYDYKKIATVNPGAKYISSVPSSCSYGYRAKTSTGQVGIVSAGHCFKKKGNTIPGIGTVTKYQNNGSLDAAFIATDNGVVLTNTLNNKPPFGNVTTISTTVGSLFVGQAIAKVGYATGYSNGSVNAASYSYTANGITYTDLVKANLPSSNGDSGGIVFEDGVTFPNNSFKTLGIMNSKGTGANEGQSLITKASKINSSFGLSRY